MRETGPAASLETALRRAAVQVGFGGPARIGVRETRDEPWHRREAPAGPDLERARVLLEVLERLARFAGWAVDASSVEARSSLEALAGGAAGTARWC